MPENYEEGYLTWSSAIRFTVIQHETHTKVNAGQTHLRKLVFHEKITILNHKHIRPKKGIVPIVKLRQT